MKVKHIIWPLLIALVLGKMAFDFSAIQPLGFYRNPVWADKAGYYVFLPYVFNAKFDASTFPDSIVEKTGNGFSIEGQKVITKYPVGVAYMQLPFYMLAKFYYVATGADGAVNPFTDLYRHTAVFSAVFYVAIAFYLLFLSLLLLGNSKLSASLTVLFIASGTSIFYYTVIEGMMSHSYSFALFAAFGFLWLKYLAGSESAGIKILLAIVCVLIVLVRPFNLAMLPIYALALSALQYKSFTMVFQPALKLLPFVIVAAVLLGFPQLLYYRHVYGSWLADSYQDESFNFLKPHLGLMFFSISSGLFIYVPAFALLFGASAFQGFRNAKQFGLILLAMVVFSYVLASWWSWSFGCGFGIRTFVEWLPLLAFPLAALINEKRKLLLAFVPIIALFAYYNYNLSYAWSGCYFGKEETFAEFLTLFW